MRTLRPVEAENLLPALSDALSGGEPIAPVPTDPAESARVLTMLRPGEPVTEPDAAVVVATSGSTGEPKGVVLSRSAVIASAAATHDRLGGPGTWFGALPGHYVAGLMVLSRSVLAGTTPRSVRSDLSDLSAALADVSGRRYLSIVPTQLSRSLGRPDLLADLARFDAVLVGGAALPADHLQAARDAGVPVVTTYGMSETCGGCVYDGSPLDGVTVEMDDDTGRIRLGGPMIFSGYRLRPDLTTQALADGKVITSDRGRWVDDRLSLLGRLDDVVICGGMNVDLAEVERLARGWPALGGADIAVIGVPDGEWGCRVVAVAEDRGPSTLRQAQGRPSSGHVVGTLDDLQRQLSDRLPRYALPRQLVRVESLPRTSGGKIDRQQLLTDLNQK